MSLFNCSKGLLNFVQRCTNISEKGIGYVFTTNCLYIGQIYQELATCFDHPNGEKITCCQFFTMNYYPHQKQLKLVLDIVFFQPNRMAYVIAILSVLCILV